MLSVQGLGFQGASRECFKGGFKGRRGSRALGMRVVTWPSIWALKWRPLRNTKKTHVRTFLKKARDHINGRLNPKP